MNTRGNTVFWAIIACLLWSTAYAGIKLGLEYDTPLHFAGLRFMISGLMILPFTVKPAIYIRMLRDNRQIFLSVTLLQTLINYSLFYLGMDLVPGSLGAVIVGSQPLVTAVVASLLHEDDKLTLGKVVTIIFGISGVILISAGRQALRLGGVVELLGVALILGANVATATSNVLVSLRSKGMNPLVLSSSSLGVGGLIIFMVSLPVEGIHRGPQPLIYWLDLLWLSFMSAFAFSLWFKLLQRPGVKVSELNLWKFIIPVVGAILSWIIVPGESPEWLTVSGMVIISVSLLLFYISNRKGEAETSKNPEK
ncbi:MAG: DMT family transporter [Bacteroidales bacterium]|nr:DMT family transporter [Bacteroidales bacterium]